VSRGRERLIAALDTSDVRVALRWAEQLRDEVGLVKVGLELFTVAGPPVLQELHRRGLRVFLDLKLHDIPNTVARTVRVLSGYGVDMTTLHASGGRAMIEAAAAARGGGGLRLLAVTVLTSLDASSLAEIGMGDRPAERVDALARMAAGAGADGVVCSPLEAAALRRSLPGDFLLVTPGVRPPGADAGDQARVATPREAVEAGASYLVVGRPITGAPDPAAAARAIVATLP
jgi:orotidine-5'-phosphate decarboxylase